MNPAILREKNIRLEASVQLNYIIGFFFTVSGTLLKRSLKEIQGIIRG